MEGPEVDSVGGNLAPGPALATRTIVLEIGQDGLDVELRVLVQPREFGVHRPPPNRPSRTPGSSTINAAASRTPMPRSWASFATT